MSLSASQKSMQTYLERHGIGKLFEDMMAKLIKEMPNEPISYLVNLLHKVSQRRVGSTAENTYPSTTLYKSGMGLTGSSIPIKQSKDPQKILPGSKPPTSLWLDSNEKEDIENHENAPRDYQKPWRTGSKQTKITKGKKESNGKVETPSWNTADSRKTVKSADDLSDHKAVDIRKSLVSKSTSSLKDNIKSIKKSRDYDLDWSDGSNIVEKENINLKSIKKSRDYDWSDGSNIVEKENNAPNYSQSKKLFSMTNSKKKSSSLGDELQIETKPQPNAKKTICSPQTYSKFKRKLSKKKSFENKEKLQALLSTDQSPKSLRCDDPDSSDYDGDEVFEDENDLLQEGVRLKNSSGVKYLRKSSPDNFKVSVCSRCAKLSGESTTKLGNEEEPTNMFDENDNFSSVSQLDSTKSYNPVWSPSGSKKNIDKSDKTSKLKGILQKSKYNHDNNTNIMSEEGKSDFFEKNNPLKTKSKQFANDMSDNDSDIEKMVLPITKAWQQQQIDDSGSEADIDDDLLRVVEMNSKGWKQKIAHSGFDSEV